MILKNSICCTSRLRKFLNSRPRAELPSHSVFPLSSGTKLVSQKRHPSDRRSFFHNETESAELLLAKSGHGTKIDASPIWTPISTLPIRGTVLCNARKAVFFPKLRRGEPITLLLQRDAKRWVAAMAVLVTMALLCPTFSSVMAAGSDPSAGPDATLVCPSSGSGEPQLRDANGTVSPISDPKLKASAAAACNASASSSAPVSKYYSVGIENQRSNPIYVDFWMAPARNQSQFFGVLAAQSKARERSSQLKMSVGLG
jgi:hypothetical protein